MEFVEVSVMGWSSTIVNVSPSTCPSCVRNSLMCLISEVFLYCETYGKRSNQVEKGKEAARIVSCVVVMRKIEG